MGSPHWNTICAASGSVATLNSDITPLFPLDAEPPIITISLILDFTSGYMANNSAILVSVAMGTSVTGSLLSMMTRRMALTACSCSSSSSPGSGKSYPSIPVLPCTLDASTNSAIRGCAAPFATGTSLPKKRRSRRVFWVTCSRDTLPATVVIRRTSNSSENSATARASASSIPGSVSIIIGLLLITFLLIYHHPSLYQRAEI